MIVLLRKQFFTVGRKPLYTARVDTASTVTSCAAAGTAAGTGSVYLAAGMFHFWAALSRGVCWSQLCRVALLPMRWRCIGICTVLNTDATCGCSAAGSEYCSQRMIFRIVVAVAAADDAEVPRSLLMVAAAASVTGVARVCS